MNTERVRSVLGVWAPMAIGLFIIVTSINFYFTATLASSILTGDLESWRLVCSAGAFFIGGLLILSTYGRYSKTRSRRKGSTSSGISAAAPTQDDEGRDESNRGHGE